MGLPWLGMRVAPLLFGVLVAWKQLVVLALIGFAKGHAVTARMPLAVGCSAVLLAVAVWHVPERVRPAAFVAVDVVLSGLFLADTLAYAQFGDIVSAESLRYAHQLGDVPGAVWALLTPTHLLLFADLPLLVYFLCRRRIAKGVERERSRGTLALVAGSAAVITFSVATDRAMANQWEGFAHVARRAGPLVFHAMNLFEYGERRLVRTRGSDSEAAAIRALLEERKRLDSRDTEYRGMLAGRSVILVHVESLQSIVLGRHVEGVPVAPHLEALRDESVSFDAFYHQAGEAHTADADVAANCSLYPLGHGAIYYEYPGNDFRCLPGLLSAHGFETLALQGIEPDFWNLRTVYPRVGFARFLARTSWNADEVLSMGISDRSFMRQAAERLLHQREPFFAFVVTLTSHSPFTAAPPVLPLGKLAGTGLGDYFNSIHYTDAALGDFVETLRSSGLLDRAILVVHGDHDGVGRYNIASSLDVPLSDTRYWFELERRVPLLIRFPHGAHATHRDDPAGELDVAPTIAGLLGLDRAEASFFGRDLFGGSEPAVYFPDGSAVDAVHLAIRQGGETECFLRGGDRVPAKRCAGLASRGSLERSLSRQLLERDLSAKVVVARSGQGRPDEGLAWSARHDPLTARARTSAPAEPVGSALRLSVGGRGPR